MITDIIFNVLLFYVVFACWFHGWICGVDHNLRPQPRFAVQVSVALCWPLIIWHAYKKWRSL